MEINETMQITLELKNPDGTSRVETNCFDIITLASKMRKMLVLILTLMIWPTS